MTQFLKDAATWTAAFVALSAAVAAEIIWLVWATERFGMAVAFVVLCAAIVAGSLAMAVGAPFEPSE